MSHSKPDAEDALENALIALLHEELGWTEWADCYHEIFQPPDTADLPDAVYLGRENRAEVVLKPRLCAALERLNPHLDPDILDQAIAELTRDRLLPRLISGELEVDAVLDHTQTGEF